MSFQPVVPVGGYAGWKFLDRTAEAQATAFREAPQMRSEIAHFRARIGAIESPAELVADPRLLKVALGAFGLSDRAGAKYLIERVLTEGAADPDALANRLPDKRFRALAEAFDFTRPDMRPAQAPGFVDRIIAGYEKRQFQAAVGRVDADLQAAMVVESELPALAGGAAGETTKWYLLLGTPALRAALGTALGLPSSVVSLDIDKQVEMFRDRTAAVFGADTVSQFAEPAKLDGLIKAFLLRSELQSGASAAAANSPALQLLTGSAAPPTGNGAAAAAALLFS